MLVYKLSDSVTRNRRFESNFKEWKIQKMNSRTKGAFADDCTE